MVSLFFWGILPGTLLFEYTFSLHDALSLSLETGVRVSFLET